MNKKTLKVTEVFYSLQGEGNASGYPFVFIRLAGCNLRCGYCDTGYSFDFGQEKTLSALLKEVDSFPLSNRVLITGGEPLLQKEGVAFLAQELLQRDKKVFIETNGSILLKDLPQNLIKIVDVKTPGSGFGDSFLLSNLDYLTPKDELKFVIAQEKDLDFAEEWLKTHFLDQKCTVHFSAVKENISFQKVALRILEKGLSVKLTLQIHKIIGLP